MWSHGIITEKKTKHQTYVAGSSVKKPPNKVNETGGNVRPGTRTIKGTEPIGKTIDLGGGNPGKAAFKNRVGPFSCPKKEPGLKEDRG